MSNLLFLKLGGSLLTDKTGVEVMRPAVMARLAAEIVVAQQQRPSLQLLLGHGSGSFGHVAAARHGTRHGVRTAAQWHGFAEVSAAAARLNRLITEALLTAGVTALSMQPSASAVCAAGVLQQMAVPPLQAALAAGLTPVVYGDVAVDTVWGGTIISTEEILIYLMGALAERPSWLLLAGETAGVLNEKGAVIPVITPDNFTAIQPALGGSRGTDVTGGMASKVQHMLNLVQRYPDLRIRIFSGLEPGVLQQLLVTPETAVGTLISVNTMGAKF